MKRRNEKLKRNGKMWTSKEDQTLLNFVNAKMKLNKIAYEMGRTLNSVRIRKSQLLRNRQQVIKPVISRKRNDMYEVEQFNAKNSKLLDDMFIEICLFGDEHDIVECHKAFKLLREKIKNITHARMNKW